jgi:hypothetical protein
MKVELSEVGWWWCTQVKSNDCFVYLYMINLVGIPIFLYKRSKKIGACGGLWGARYARGAT